MNEVGQMLGVIIPILVIGLVVVFLFKQSYIKAPPNKAAIISGLGEHPRMFRGKAGFKVPFLEAVNWLNVEVININIRTEEYIPTKDFINVKVDAISQVSLDLSDTGVQIAMRNFLDKEENDVRAMITESLQGNLREIIGTMDLKAISQDKAQFSAMVKENAQDDMAKLGIVINSFNVQSVLDKDGLIDDLGIDNREQIKKDASIAKAAAQRDVTAIRSNGRSKQSRSKGTNSNCTT